MRRLLLLILCLILIGCNEDTHDLNANSKGSIEGVSLMEVSSRGFSLSPKTFDEEGMTDFLDRMKNFSVLRWAGSITELDEAPVYMSELRKTNDFSILISTNLYEPSEKANIEERITHLVDYTDTHKPEYIELGVEINSKFSDNLTDIKSYAGYFNQAYEAIKGVSPDTEIIVSFQYEWLLGLRDGLFGAESSEATWYYLDLFNSDIIGFTTYPCLYYQDPIEIPRNYYNQIKDHTKKPIAFTEIGWYSGNTIENWESSEEEQYRFINRYFELTEEIKPQLEVWSFMYEVFDAEPFKTMNLASKKGYDLWRTKDFISMDIKPVYFVSRADHEAGELYRLSGDGYIERLTFNERHENNVALSFDGGYISYHGGEESDLLSYEIYVMDLETLEEKQMTDNHVLDGHPDWLSDNQLVYASFNKNGEAHEFADIYTLDIETRQSHILVSSDYEDNDPEVSPDGKWLAFKSTRNTKEAFKEEIFLMSLETDEIRQLTHVEGYMSDHDPSWASDSKAIVFERFEGSRDWVDIAKPEIMMTHMHELTPWNNYQVDLEGHLTQLTGVDQNQIAFLPVFNGEDLLYIHMDFISQNKQVIGASKQLLKQDVVTLETIKYLYDTRHRYTLEYFDW